MTFKITMRDFNYVNATSYAEEFTEPYDEQRALSGEPIYSKRTCMIVKDTNDVSYSWKLNYWRMKPKEDVYYSGPVDIEIVAFDVKATDVKAKNGMRSFSIKKPIFPIGQNEMMAIAGAAMAGICKEKYIDVDRDVFSALVK